MDNTEKLNVVSFFSGYSGIERGLELAGERVRTVAFCEIEAYAAANLIDKMEAGTLYPAPIWTNIKTFPSLDFRGKVDLISRRYGRCYLQGVSRTPIAIIETV